MHYWAAIVFLLHLAGVVHLPSFFPELVRGMRVANDVLSLIPQQRNGNEAATLEDIGYHLRFGHCGRYCSQLPTSVPRAYSHSLPSVLGSVPSRLVRTSDNARHVHAHGGLRHSYSSRLASGAHYHPDHSTDKGVGQESPAQASTSSHRMRAKQS
jgi:hypothetical protein